MIDDHVAVPLETNPSKLGVIAEGMSAMRQAITALKQAVNPIPQTANGITIMKAASYDLSLAQNRGERRVAALEMPQRA